MLEFIGGVILAVLIAYALVENIAIVWDLLTPGRRSKDAVTIGADSLVGRRAVVTAAFQSPNGEGPRRGSVRVSGETWAARIDESYGTIPDQGDRVEIVGVDGLLLEVVPTGDA